MAKIIDYPRASLRASLQLAEAVSGFGGACSVELAAEQLGKKVSGAFSALVSAAVKYGLVENKGGKLLLSPLYRSYKLSYTPDEARSTMKDMLLSPPLFQAIYSRFRGQRLPVAHFEKMLVREFEVPQEIASRVGGYFLDGAKQCGLLNGENQLMGEEGGGEAIGEEEEEGNEAGGGEAKNLVESRSQEVAAGLTVVSAPSGLCADGYSIVINGPSMNFSIVIKGLDDLEIVEFMLKKISRAMKAGADSFGKAPASEEP